MAKKTDFSNRDAINTKISDSGISVIKYEGDNETFVWKHPIEDFNYGSRLIVHQSQEAVFYLNGEALDVFGPGDHTLETENLPILKKFAHLPTGNRNPFHAEVYFVNLAVHMSVKWGTDSKIRFIEPNTGIPLDLGASGELNIRVSNSRKVLDKLVGTTVELKNNDLFGANALRAMFRPLIQNVVKANLAGSIKNSNINILEIDEHLTELSEDLQTKLSPKFDEYGFAVNEFYITNFVLPENDKNFNDLKALMSASYIKVREQEVKAKIAEAERQTIIEQEKNLTEKQKYETERKVIEAQGEAASSKAKGFAEAEVMAAKGYSQKDVIQAEVQKAYAEGIGNFGANGGSLGGGLASDVIGLGVGVAAAGTLGGQLNGMLNGMNPNMAPQADSSASGWKCTECGADGNHGRFCSECGKPKAEEWDCALCGAKGNHGRFCSECGQPKPEAWDCPECGAKGNRGKFCSECGKPKAAVSDAWDCKKCGHTGNHGKFCDECGSKKEEN